MSPNEITINDVRPAVERWAIEMERVLRKHDSKKAGLWHPCPPQSLFQHLKIEVNELEAEFKKTYWLNIDCDECIDIANMAMMVRDAIKFKIDQSKI